ncbi:hypothetical protein AX15_000593 [Amanita polypyramis BW_CC]|nr:hypothetical protein AX15_000593 [Amanita polypyramis BW_CC]
MLIASMAIPPSTSDTRGRSPASKPLAVTNATGPIGGPDAATDEPPPPTKSDGNVTLAAGGEVPHADASELPADQALASSSEPREFTSDSEFWQQMTTTLEACFNIPNGCDDDGDDAFFMISDDMLAGAPRVMQTFLSHGDACTKIEAEALDLASNRPVIHDDDDPLRVYREILDDLEQLQEKAGSLELTISRLAGETTDQSQQKQCAVERDENGDEDVYSKLAAHSELRRVFAACLPVLRLRIANLTMAQDLIDSVQENLSITLRMEYLGIS